MRQERTVDFVSNACEYSGPESLTYCGLRKAMQTDKIQTIKKMSTNFTTRAQHYENTLYKDKTRRRAGTLQVGVKNEEHSWEKVVLVLVCVS